MADEERPPEPAHVLWLGDDRFYLLPQGLKLPPGPLELHNLDGDEQKVDPEVANAFEVSEDEATKFLGEAYDRIAARVGEVVATFADVFAKAASPNAAAGAPATKEALALRGLIETAVGLAAG